MDPLRRFIERAMELIENIRPDYESLGSGSYENMTDLVDIKTHQALDTLHRGVKLWRNQEPERCAAVDNIIGDIADLGDAYLAGGMDDDELGGLVDQVYKNLSALL